MQILKKSIKVGDKYIFPFESKNELIEYVLDKNQILVAINAEKILNKDKDLTEIINRNIGYPDGIGAVLALKKKGYNAIKIPGVELWLDIINEVKEEKSFYFLGGSEEVINLTIKKLKNEYHNINIVGYRNGYFNFDEEQNLITEIISKKPDIVYVAMGSPKQELIMNRLSKVHHALYMGLGGSFDVYCDSVKRAPKLFQKLGLEWFYRLIKQPTRIKRQVIYFKFIILLFLKRI